MKAFQMVATRVVKMVVGKDVRTAVSKGAKMAVYSVHLWDALKAVAKVEWSEYCEVRTWDNQRVVVWAPPLVVKWGYLQVVLTAEMKVGLREYCLDGLPVVMMAA